MSLATEFTDDYRTIERLGRKGDFWGQFDALRYSFYVVFRVSVATIIVGDGSPAGRQR